MSKIKFDISKNQFVDIKIYDISGRKVTTLVGQQLNAGTYEITWDASRFSSGIYFAKLQTENYSKTIRLILVK